MKWQRSISRRVDPAPIGTPRGSCGISVSQAAIDLPEGFSVAPSTDAQLENVFIGSDGLSGRITGAWNTTESRPFGIRRKWRGNIFGSELPVENSNWSFKADVLSLRRLPA